MHRIHTQGQCHGKINRYGKDQNTLFVEVMTDLPVPQTTITKGFDEVVVVLLVGGITGGIVLWI